MSPEFTGNNWRLLGHAARPRHDTITHDYREMPRVAALPRLQANCGYNQPATAAHTFDGRSQSRVLSLGRAPGTLGDRTG